MSDQFLYEDIANTHEEYEPFVRKQLIYTQDNVSSYAGTIQIETSSLASSGLYAALSDAWLEIPYVVTFKGSSTTAAEGSIISSANPYMFAIKNGFHQLINSITVEMNSVTVVQQSNFTNMYVGYKLMTTFSEGDVKKYGPTIGFSPDTADSFQYSATGTFLAGNGNTNNNLYKDPATYYTVPTSGLRTSTNKGLADRVANSLDFTTYSLTQNQNSGGYNSGIRQLLSLDRAKACGFHILTDNGGANQDRVYSFHVVAHIRLKDLCDFFDKIPLIKAPFLKIFISYNGVSSQTISYSKANTSITCPTANSSIIGQCNPVLFASAETGNPNNAVLLKAGDGATDITNGSTKSIIYSANVGSSGGVSHITFQNCRLYCPMYQMSPTIERNLLQTSPTKRVVYKDIYSFTISNISAGATFTQLVTSSIINPKTVIVIPITSSTSNGSSLMPALQSPFSSEGATTAPYAFIQNFQVQVSGSNVFQNAVQYDFEMFCQELSKVNALNGGMSSGLQSGLISHLDFQRAYRYYVADISRRISPAEDGVSKSITVQGINATSVTMEYYVFIEFQRECVISLSSGKIETL